MHALMRMAINAADVRRRLRNLIERYTPEMLPQSRRISGTRGGEAAT